MTAPVRVAIAGASGRMGLALLEAAAQTEGVMLGAAIDLSASTWGGVSIGTDVGSALTNSDVLIDFTRPAGTVEHVRECLAQKRAMVIGTTGFATEQLAEIKKAAKKIPIVMAPNMSIGVNVALKLVEMAARALGPDYDIEVFEMHHKKKVDAPSGTALRLGEVAARARAATLERDGVFTRHGVTGERKAGSIGFSVARGGDTVGDHTVFFAGPGERIEITHRSSSRATYAQGAMRAARFVAGKTPGLYDMDDVLGLS
ncbi:MAG TPA: 4-hydroxy-tetrahydrodipicolinate reductase [Usitatibacter sp.]|nr:4-hydroxy-tetrahydrodipicolinate reductase [Usitatibacter sp.]